MLPRPARLLLQNFPMQPHGVVSVLWRCRLDDYVAGMDVGEETGLPKKGVSTVRRQVDAQ